MAIYEQHHKDNPMVMELTQEPQALYEGEYTAIIADLSSNWAEYVAYDNLFAKVQRLWQPCWPSSMPILQRNCAPTRHRQSAQDNERKPSTCHELGEILHGPRGHTREGNLNNIVLKVFSHMTP